MGYAFCVGPCFGCNRVLAYNPVSVPSVKDKEGKKQPLCASCVSWMQNKQREQGQPVWPDPLPDAYEACLEEELV